MHRHFRAVLREQLGNGRADTRELR